MDPEDTQKVQLMTIGDGLDMGRNQGCRLRFLTCTSGGKVEVFAGVHCPITSGMGEDCGSCFSHIEPEVFETSECIFHKQFDVWTVSSEERGSMGVLTCVSTK